MSRILVSQEIQGALDEDALQHHREKKYRPTGVGMIERIENGQRQLLLVQSKKNLGWGFPKGGTGKREGVVKGTLRELREELGLRKLFVLAHYLTESVDKPPLKSHFTLGKRLYFFHLQMKVPEVIVLQLDEILKIEWVTYSDVPEFLVSNNPDESRREKVACMLRAYAKLPTA
jgi:8-oxo-dGTP pyrophosphatase MutT (NUDIX family)